MPHMFVDSETIMNTVKNTSTYRKNVQAPISLVTKSYGLIDFTPEDKILTTKPELGWHSAV